MTYFINVTDHNGKIHQLEATVGFSLMEIIRDAGLDIVASLVFFSCNFTSSRHEVSL